MSCSFRVRQLDPYTTLRAPDPEGLRELEEIENILGKAFNAGQLFAYQILSWSYYTIHLDLFIAIASGHDPKGIDTSYVGPLCKSVVVAGLVGGEVYVAEATDTQKKIVGCAVWFGPGHTLYDRYVV
jgi:hypothetical protein